MVLAGIDSINPATDNSAEILLNGGFETGRILPWYIDYSGTRIGNSTITTPGHNGTYAEKYTITQAGTGWYELVQSVTVEQGKTYNAQFWYKSTVSSGSVAFYCYDSDWSNIIATSRVGISATGDTWTKGSFQISIPINPAIVHTELCVTLGNTTGTLILDDVSMNMTDIP
jgi:hypothetical protein